MRILTMLSVTAAAGVLSGCAVTKSVVDTKSEISVKRSIEDVTAARAIRARMLRVEGHDLNDVSVDVVQGIVVLAGATPNPTDKKEAERIAWSAPGVSKVGNEIYVGRSTGLGSKTKDEFITTAVRTKLATSNNVRNLNFNLETRDGVVYLMGVARSKEELAEAARLASITKGVKEVVSYATVKGDIPNGFGQGYSGAPQTAQTSISLPSSGDDTSFWGTQVEGSETIYGPQGSPQNGNANLGSISEPMPYTDPSAPLPYNPGNVTQLDPDALNSGKPILRDPYTGEEIILPPGVKPLPYIPPSPGSLGAGAKPLPPGAAEKMAQQKLEQAQQSAQTYSQALPQALPQAIPQALPQAQAMVQSIPQAAQQLASPNDPGPLPVDQLPPDGASVTLTAPYTLDPATGKRIPVRWDGKQWVGVVR